MICEQKEDEWKRKGRVITTKYLGVYKLTRQCIYTVVLHRHESYVSKFTESAFSFRKLWGIRKRRRFSFNHDFTLNVSGLIFVYLWGQLLASLGGWQSREYWNFISLLTPIRGLIMHGEPGAIMGEEAEFRPRLRSHWFALLWLVVIGRAPVSLLVGACEVHSIASRVLLPRWSRACLAMGEPLAGRQYSGRCHCS